MKFGLPDTTIENIQKVFENNAKIDEVIVFGSRAKGNYKEGSDIDLAVKGFDIEFKDILALSGHLDDLNLPYKIDLLNYAAIKEKALVEHIDRVGIVFYERWKEVKLGKYVDVINGYAFKSLDFLNNKIDDALPVIKIKNVANGDVNLNDVQYHLYKPYLKKFLIEKNDILIALTGNHPEVMTQVVGDASLYKLNEKGLLNQRVAKIITKEGLNKNYLYYFLKDDATHHELASNSAGSANQANISKTDIENLSLSLPPYKVQTLIASILSSLDDKIDLLQRQNKTLEQLAETLFRQWFIEEAEEGWEVGKIIDLFILQRGFDLPAQKRIEGKYLVITASGANGFHNEYKVKAPGVTTGRSGLLGEVFYIDTDFWPLNTSLFIVEYKLATPLYAYYFLKTLDLAALNGGSAVPTLNRNDVHDLVTQLPPKDLILKSESIMQIFYKKMQSNNNQIKQLAQLRDALLPKLMSGDVRVNT